MTYKVLTYFEDLQDGGHPYNPGDVFPRIGKRVSAERLAELSSDKNLRGVKLIEAESMAVPKVEQEAQPEPQPTAKKRSKKTK